MNPLPRTISVFKTAFAWYLKSYEKRGSSACETLATESVTLNCLSNPWSVALQCVCCCCAVHNVKFDILLASPLCFVFVSVLGCSNARLVILLGIFLGKYNLFFLENIILCCIILTERERLVVKVMWCVHCPACFSWQILGCTVTNFVQWKEHHKLMYRCNENGSCSELKNKWQFNA